MVETERYQEARLWRTADTLDDWPTASASLPPRWPDTVEQFNRMVADGADTDPGRGDEGS